MDHTIQRRNNHSDQLGPENHNVEPSLASTRETLNRPRLRLEDLDTLQGHGLPAREINDGFTSFEIERRRTKRPRTETTRSAMSYPRKRAVRACELCRTRKTKCNNVRPICGACSQIGAHCVFEDTLDHSSFDPASLIMLERLNQIIDTLSTHLVPGPVNSGLQQQGSDTFQSVVQEEIQDERRRNAICSDPIGHNHVPDGEANYRTADQNTSSQYSTNEQDDLSSSEYLYIPACRTTPSTILQWPIFEAKYPTDCLDQSFVLSSEASADPGPTDVPNGSSWKSNGERSAHGGFGVREEEIEGLIDDFLALVHIKNPILQPDLLRLYARNVAENGPQWDSKSCLVYLACSLGCLAQSFQSKGFRPADSADPHESTSEKQDYQNLRHAEAYYSLARKRIGLLLPSIMTAHCYFFSGVYLMYVMHPLQAWNNFYQASTLCHMCLQSRKPLKNERAIRLEQCLYWSCFKSECEMRGELPLPLSALGTIEYPHLFPNPPEVSSPATEAKLGHGGSSSEPYSPATSAPYSHRQESLASYSEDQSWYYYLTEIALRRTGNRVLNTFFKEDSSSWLNASIPAIVKIAKKFENEINQRVDGLPDSLRYVQQDLRILPEEELPHLIRARIFEIRSWICRPFLFYAVHRPADDPNQILIRGFVQDSLEYSFRSIESVAHRHRHPGTWYALRSGTSAAFRIIAAVKCGHVDVPLGWKHVILKHISTLKYWEMEALDFAKARGILEELLTETGMGSEEIPGAGAGENCGP